MLLRTGNVPVAAVMRRLLTGYAVTFNRAVKELGMNGSAVAKLLGIIQSSASRAVQRGEKLALDSQLRLDE